MDRVHLIKKWIFFRESCGFLCYCELRIGCKLSCYGSSDREDKYGAQLVLTRKSFFSTSHRCSRKRSANLLPVSPT